MFEERPPQFPMLVVLLFQPQSEFREELVHFLGCSTKPKPQGADKYTNWQNKQHSMNAYVTAILNFKYP